MFIDFFCKSSEIHVSKLFLSISIFNLCLKTTTYHKDDFYVSIGFCNDIHRNTILSLDIEQKSRLFYKADLSKSMIKSLFLFSL